MADSRSEQEEMMTGKDSSVGEVELKPQGVMYEIQRLLLGRPAARLLYELREEEIRNRNPLLRKIRLPQESSWVVTSNHWPVDGSWQPVPTAVTLLGTNRFRKSVERLRASFDEQPLTSSAAFEKYEEAMAPSRQRSGG